MKFILGTKVGMSQIFDEQGVRIPVTLIEAGPCYVTQVKEKNGQEGAKDGYEAVQIGFQKLKDKKIKKSRKSKPFKYIREFKGSVEVKAGEEITVSSFQQGDIVKISGISKGKGFAGVVKRWGFRGRPATHGVKHEQRAPGSVGTSFPEHVAKGRKMAGRMGYERTTVKNLKIIKIIPEENLLAIKGAIPGRKGTLLEIRG